MNLSQNYCRIRHCCVESNTVNKFYSEFGHQRMYLIEMTGGLGEDRCHLPKAGNFASILTLVREILENLIWSLLCLSQISISGI